MRAGYSNSTNKRTEPLRNVKTADPGFKIICFCNFLVLYKYRGLNYFQKYVEVYIKYIFPSFKFHLEKERYN